MGNMDEITARNSSLYARLLLGRARHLMVKARQKELLAFPITDFLREESLTTTVRMYPPEKKGHGLVLDGDINETADKLVAILKEKTTVLR